MKSLKVKEYMSTRLVTFRVNMNVVEAMGILLQNRISGGPVVDEEGNMVGVLSEVDLMQVVVQDSYYDESMGIVGDYMQSQVETVTPEVDIYSVAQMFITNHRRRYPVVSESGKLVGQISRRDVLRAVEAFLHREK